MLVCVGAGAISFVQVSNLLLKEINYSKNLKIITIDLRCDWKAQSSSWCFTPEIHLILSFLFPGKQQRCNTMYQRGENDVTRQ